MYVQRTESRRGGRPIDVTHETVVMKISSYLDLNIKGDSSCRKPLHGQFSRKIAKNIVNKSRFKAKK